MDRRFFSDRVPELEGGKAEAEAYCQKLFFPVAILTGWSEETGSLFLNRYRPREVATVFALMLCDALGEKRAVMRELFTEEGRALLCHNAEEVARAQKMGIEAEALSILRRVLNLPEEISAVGDRATLDRITTIVAYVVSWYLRAEEREIVREEKERTEALADAIVEAIDAGEVVYSEDDRIQVEIARFGKPIRVDIYP